MYEVILLKKAQSYYKRCSKPVARRLNECFEQMETDPLAAGDVKPLYGEHQGYYRLRIGTIRIIFKVVVTENKVYIANISPRGDAYK
jgi:mRNA-degrading endonuclease RelE of RelBE toxin-antitoxin system